MIRAGHEERRALEQQVAALNDQVIMIEQTERTAREQAQEAIQGLRREVEAAKNNRRGGTLSRGRRI